MRSLCSLLVAALLAATPVLAAEYRESFDAGSDPAKIMAGTLLIGDDGVWTGALEDGAYRLSNPGKDGAIRFYHFGFPGRSAASATGRTEVAVDVEGRFDGRIAGAGLLYRFDPAARTYYAFVVMKEGAYSLWQRTAEGLRRVASGSNAAIKPAGANSLLARLQGGKAEVFVNETRIVGHSLGAGQTGHVGIVAFDRGAYRFDNFRLSAE